MNTFIIKTHPEQHNSFPFLIHILSLIPGVKNWYIESESEAGDKLLKLETTKEIGKVKLQTLLNLYGIQVEIQS